MSRPTLRALGLMSGTSLDGIDLALIETDGEARVRRLSSATVPYTASFRASLRHALSEARQIRRRDERPGRLATIERELTDLHADAVLQFIGNAGLQPSAIDVIGFHGQTVLHRPDIGLTVQIGDGPRLAGATGIDVAYDLRAADCAAGGQGAPLIPVYHRALASVVGDLPLAFLNIGGVANVTWIGPGDALLAFDTGPGNALLDDWALRHTGHPIDRDGALARSGSPDPGRLETALDHPYFRRPAPKSLDRGDFTLAMVEGLSAADGAATLAAFTVGAIGRSRLIMPEPPVRWIVAGGGRRNPELMDRLAAAVGAPVSPAEAFGWDGDSLEAEAWAYLAVRSLVGLPITFPGTTGVPKPMTGGALARAP